MPVLVLTGRTAVVGFFVLNGIVEIGLEIAGRGSVGWLCLLGSGVLSILLAGVLWAGFPSIASWAVGLLVGVNLVSTSLSRICVGRAGDGTPAGDLTAGDRGQQT